MPRSAHRRGDIPPEPDQVRFLAPGDDATSSTDVQQSGSSAEVLDAPRTIARRSRVLWAVAALGLATAVSVAGLEHTSDIRTPPRASSGIALSPSGGQAPDIALAPLRHYVVSDVTVLTGSQVLHVDYEPSPTISYVGGTVTLYAPHDFDAGSFVMMAQRTAVNGHVAYFGRYQQQFAIAWPVRGGRWVCLTGFIGAGSGTDPRISRTEELAVAAGVLVR